MLAVAANNISSLELRGRGLDLSRFVPVKLPADDSTLDILLAGAQKRGLHRIQFPRLRELVFNRFGEAFLLAPDVVRSLFPALRTVKFNGEITGEIREALSRTFEGMGVRVEVIGRGGDVEEVIVERPEERAVVREVVVERPEEREAVAPEVAGERGRSWWGAIKGLFGMD